MFLSLAGKFEDSLSRLSELFPSDIPMTSRRREKEVVSEPKVTEKPEAGWVATITRVWAKRKMFWESGSLRPIQADVFSPNSVSTLRAFNGKSQRPGLDQATLCGLLVSSAQARTKVPLRCPCAFRLR